MMVGDILTLFLGVRGILVKIGVFRKKLRELNGVVLYSMFINYI